MKKKNQDQDWQSFAYTKTDSRIPKSKAKTVLHQYHWLDFDDSAAQSTKKPEQKSMKSDVRIMLEEDGRFSDEMIDLIEETH